MDRPDRGRRRTGRTSASSTSGKRLGAVDEAERRPARAAPPRVAVQDFSRPAAATCASRRRASGDWLPRPSVIEGRVHQHPIGRRSPSPIASRDRSRLGHVRLDQADAAGEARRSPAASAPRVPRRRGRRRARRRSTVSAGARAATREGDRADAGAEIDGDGRSHRTGRAPAAAPRRARRDGPSRGCTSVTSPPRKASTVCSCLAVAARVAITKARAPARPRSGCGGRFHAGRARPACAAAGCRASLP